MAMNAFGMWPTAGLCCLSDILFPDYVSIHEVLRCTSYCCCCWVVVVVFGHDVGPRKPEERWCHDHHSSSYYMPAVHVLLPLYSPSLLSNSNYHGSRDHRTPPPDVALGAHLSVPPSCSLVSAHPQSGFWKSSSCPTPSRCTTVHPP